MAYRKFRLRIITRLIILLTLGFATVYVLTSTYFWLVSLWLGIGFVISLGEFIRYIEKHNKALSNFLTALRQNDFSISYAGKIKHDDNPEVYEALENIASEFQKLRKEKEANHQFLQMLVEHVSIPLIGYDESGQVKIYNQAAKELFHKPYIHSLQGLEAVDPELPGKIKGLKPGTKKLYKYPYNGIMLPLSLSVSKIRFEDGNTHIVSFQNIKSELDEKELESWQKLIRVLTHEIMNSVIPISTLSNVLNKELSQYKDTLVDKDIEHDLRHGLNTIATRSQGLVSFIEAYKNITRLPKPEFQRLEVSVIYDRILSLMQEEASKNDVLINNKAKDTKITILADMGMLEQVLINIVKNSMEAFGGQEKKVIDLDAETEDERTSLIISDNGPGIPEDVLDNIFVPFFTTKKEGSGIGLAFSRQVMQLHNGSINVLSSEKGTDLKLIF